MSKVISRFTSVTVETNNSLTVFIYAGGHKNAASDITSQVISSIPVTLKDRLYLLNF